MNTDPAGDSDAQILVWEDDPGEPGSPNQLISRPVPEIGRLPLPIAIDAEAPSPGEPPPTQAPHYWATADALRRAGDFWGAACGQDTPWHESVGTTLSVLLDEGEDFNAYYDRKALNFFHGSVGDEVLFSANSGDVSAHEFGHAVLDALQPGLWNVHSAEPPALHEAFGDMSAMLTALQLPSLRSEVIAATSGKLDRSSRLSRLAEQLGWAIRQSHPDAVDADSLRNAANSLFYRDPLQLPPMGPASELSSEPHSLSRVFSGAFLKGLAGMFLSKASHDEAALEEVSHDAGTLLAAAARDTPVTVAYFSQFAAHMLAADQASFNGAYSEALRDGFVKHGVLALSSATSPPPAGMVADGPAEPGPGRVALSGTAYGLDEELLVHAAAAAPRFDVAGAAPDTGSAPVGDYEAAAAGYVEDVFRRGHVAIDPEIRTGNEVVAPPSHATHEVRREDDGLVMVRRLFACGHHCHGE